MSLAIVLAGRRQRQRRRATLIGVLAALTAAAYVASLTFGLTTYSIVDVLRVALGIDVPGASFTVGELRLPRATMAVLAGAGFAIAGVTFQTMLRNPLAAPDIIGISAGAATAAVAGIVLFSLDETAVSLVALAAAVATAAVVYLLSHRNGFAGTRLILIGIAVAAFLDSITAYLLSKAGEWDMQSAMQWLTGSLNGTTWAKVVPMALASLLIVPVLVVLSARTDLLGMGDDLAAALGVRVTIVRVGVTLGAVTLLAFGTAACGPIAFVALMSGPIAARIMGSTTALVVPAALVGASLVLVADFVGQNAFDNRFPVGVVTGCLGAPFLIFFLVKVNSSGRSL